MASPNRMKYSDYKAVSDLDKELPEVTYDPRNPESHGYETDFDLDRLSTTAIGPRPAHTQTDWPAGQQKSGKKSLMVLMRYLVTRHELTDVRVLIGGCTFHCHRLVLHCYSRYFRERHHAIGSPTEYRLPEERVSARAFVLLYDWMIAYKPVLQRTCFVEVFRAAEYLQVRELEQQCWHCVKAAGGMRDRSAFELFVEAKAAQFASMETFLLGRISRYFLPLAGTKDFRDLTAGELTALLSSDAVAVNNEMEVLCSAVLWLFDEWPLRRKYVLQVLAAVRFNLMPCWYLSSLAKRVQCERLRTIFSIDDVQQMLIPYIHYTTSLKNRTLANHEMSKFFVASKTRIHGPRRWIFDADCPYHHHLMCSRLPSLTVLMFEENCKRLLSPEWRNAWQDFTLVSYPDEDVADSVSQNLQESDSYRDRVRVLLQCPNNRCPGHISNSRLPWTLLKAPKSPPKTPPSKAPRAASPPPKQPRRPIVVEKPAPQVAKDRVPENRSPKKDCPKKPPPKSSAKPRYPSGRGGESQRPSEASDDSKRYPWRRVHVEDIYREPPKRKAGPAPSKAAGRRVGGGDDDESSTSSRFNDPRRQAHRNKSGAFNVGSSMKPRGFGGAAKGWPTGHRQPAYGYGSTSSVDTDASVRPWKAVRGDFRQRLRDEKMKARAKKFYRGVPRVVSSLDDWDDARRVLCSEVD